jgi:hypothetical protein
MECRFARVVRCRWDQGVGGPRRVDGELNREGGIVLSLDGWREPQNRRRRMVLASDLEGSLAEAKRFGIEAL